uniref:Retrovirus-related Pol polyprotein LINE-1 n=1 Tax=Cajanus cajan TaxID=3821 RepID=A0A151U6F9_CAJCA|nr:Retrovirus-related Pol polyprotein LINE-1 [Cajanus cajan]
MSIEEVRSVVFFMSPYKMSSPDGFQPIFYKTYWEIVGQKVCDLLRTTFTTSTFPRQLAETLIVDIPKVDKLTSMKEFRPISLCNVLFKIISKILVHRLRPHMDSIIGKVGSLLFKINFEKAYDKVNWDFLHLTLMEFGFPSSTIDLIMNCTCSTSLALKSNNEILEGFQPNRGLKVWKSIKVSQGGPEISHLFFANNCLLFTKATCGQVKLVKEVLDIFCKASGLKVNIQKSRFFTSICNNDFSHILDIINGKLTGWKSNTLNRAGRVTLAKVVLSSILTYTM